MHLLLIVVKADSIYSHGTGDSIRISSLNDDILQETEFLIRVVVEYW